MVNSYILLTFIFSVALSWLLTGYVMRYAVSKNLLDIPNKRSSHTIPTPRGGGVAIVAVLLLSVIFTLFMTESGMGLLLCLALSTLAFAILGWQDDKHDLSASSRFLIQVLIAALSAGWLLWNLPGWSLTFVGTGILLASILWIVWMVNVYNFMDGIDGLSAVETLVLGFTTAYWFLISGSNSIAILCVAVAGAAVGFLRWNWSPAKVFMGDVGSLALGGFFSILAIIGTSSLDIPVLAFLILYAVYLADAGFTLMRRLLKKEKWWQAHRTHFYQRAVQSGFSHRQVSLAVLGINVILATLASLLISDVISPFVAIVITMGILSLSMFLINSRFKSFINK